MTFLQIVDDTLERLNLPLDASSSARTRVMRYVNEAYRLLLAELGLGRTRHATTTISTVAGTKEYTVTASKIAVIRDTANDTRLDEVSLAEIRAIDPGDDSDGNPTSFAIVKTTSTTVTVRLWPTPSDAWTLDVDILAAVTALSADGDIPVFDSEFHHALAIYARACEYEKSDDTRYRDTMKEYVNVVRALRFYRRKSSTRTTIQGGASRGYTSSLGPNFPDRQ